MGEVKFMFTSNLFKSMNTNSPEEKGEKGVRKSKGDAADTWRHGVLRAGKTLRFISSDPPLDK